MLPGRLVDLGLEELLLKADVDLLVDLEGWDRLAGVELAKSLTGGRAFLGVELGEVDAVRLHVLARLSAHATPLGRVHRDVDAPPSEVPFPFGAIGLSRPFALRRSSIELRTLWTRLRDRNVLPRDRRRRRLRDDFRLGRARFLCGRRRDDRSRCGSSDPSLRRDFGLGPE